VTALAFVSINLLHLVVGKNIRCVFVVMTGRTGYYSLVRLLGVRMAPATGTGLDSLDGLMTALTTVSFDILEILMGKVLGRHIIAVTIRTGISGVR